MNRLPERELRIDDADAEENGRPPCAEALLAATLALMTGFAEHCTVPAEGESERQAPAAAVPRLLAAKAASNLFFLAGHPSLPVPLRSTIWRLREHWEALEKRAARHAGAPAAEPRAAAPPVAGEAWTGAEPAPVWH